MLAELMLPDQTHRRNQDWTIFFLHKEEEETEGDPGQQPLIYVLNLVNTKRDNRIKRYATFFPIAHLLNFANIPQEVQR